MGESKGKFYFKFGVNKIIYPYVWIQDGKYFDDNTLDFIIPNGGRFDNVTMYDFAPLTHFPGNTSSTTRKPRSSQSSNTPSKNTVFPYLFPSDTLACQMSGYFDFSDLRTPNKAFEDVTITYILASPDCRLAIRGSAKPFEGVSFLTQIIF